jgi:hypothetical protein
MKRNNRTKKYSQIDRDLFRFYVTEIVGVEVEDATVDNDDCLHFTHLNSSFFFTLVKPTQTR